MNDNNLRSRTVNLRLADEDDAAFIYSLRINKSLNKHISKVNGSVENQMDWLKVYKEREHKNEEFYFIISRNDNNEAIGTVRVYGITNENKFCWGSWILNENKTVTAALESAYLVYKFAFEIKNYHSAYFQVDKENTTVITFHKKIGAVFKFKDDVNENFEYPRESFSSFKNRYINLVEG